MAVFGNIPLPGNGNEAFKDVMDYFEQIQKRRALQKQADATLKQQQEHFGITNKLEHEKLNETANYHKQSLAQSAQFEPLKLELLKAKIDAAKNPNKSLSPQERSEKMKLLSSGRASLSLIKKTDELEKILTENPDLTGMLPYLKNIAGHGGEKLGNFTTTAGDVQALIGKIASQRGGAQIIKWAEKMKASDWKDVETNLGHVRGLRTDTRNDLNDIGEEYKYLTGEDFPLKGSKKHSGNPEGTTVMHKNGKVYHIPNADVSRAEKKGYTK